MIEKKSIDIVFYDFESQNSELLSEVKTDDGILLWQIIKRPLFYKIVHHNHKQSTIIREKLDKPKMFYFLHSFLKLLKIFFLRKKVLFFTTDFRRKKLGNETIEPLIDSVIQFENPQNFIVGVHRRYLRKKEPKTLRNKPNFDLNILYYFKYVFNLFYKVKDSENLKKISNSLNEYLQKESINLTFDLHQAILEIFKNHNSERVVFSFFYRLINPEKIYAVDSLATGMHHAACKQSIEFYEIQHGFISDYKADYILHPKLNRYRNSLLIPQKIFLFGDFYKNILIRRSIWNSSDIQTFHRIDSQKRKSMVANKVQTFFYPHQWVFYEETLTIIRAFGNSDKKLKIKIHPNEQKSKVNEFLHLCSAFSNIEVLGKDISTFDAISDVDCTFGFFTTMLLETASMNIPTLTLKLNSDTKKTSLHQYVEDDKLKNIIKEYDFDTFIALIPSEEKLNIDLQISHENYLQV